MRGWRLQRLVEAAGRVRLSILDLQLAKALAAVTQAPPLPDLLLALAVIPHTKPLRSVPDGTSEEQGLDVKFMHSSSTPAFSYAQGHWRGRGGGCLSPRSNAKLILKINSEGKKNTDFFFNLWNLETVPIPRTLTMTCFFFSFFLPFSCNEISTFFFLTLTCLQRGVS